MFDQQMMQRRRELAISTAMQSLGGNPTIDDLLQASERIEKYMIDGTTKSDATVGEESSEN